MRVRAGKRGSAAIPPPLAGRRLLVRAMATFLAAALTVGLSARLADEGRAALPSQSEPSTSTPSGPAMNIYWAFRPDALGPLAIRSQAAVTATVEAIAPGTPLVTADEPDVAPIPTSLVTVNVDDRWFGEVADRFVVFMTGSSEVWSPEAPPFKVGERYVLFVEPRGDGTYFMTAPDGRLIIVDGTVQPVAAGEMAEKVRGKSVEAIRRAAKAAKEGKPE